MIIKMHKLLRLLLIFGFVILVNGKGGGGSGGGGGFVVGGGSHGGGGSLSDSDLLYLGIFVPIILICCCLVCCNKERLGDPSETNETFVTSNRIDEEQGKEEVYLSNVFQSGIWSCRYYQYDKWHGPHRLTLLFNNVDMTIKGSGTDDVGSFTAEGIYSESTRRIGLTEHYHCGTGDPRQNLGHNVTIQVIYNARSNQFEGKWYVQTHKYKGEDEIEFKFLECHA